MSQLVKGHLMNKVIFTAVALSLGGCNAEYIKTVNRQLAESYRWVEIPCRPASPDMPAITIDAPNGRKLVCNVLQK